jgi:hypothetical protein
VAHQVNLNDLPERYRKQAEAQLGVKPARPHADVEPAARHEPVGPKENERLTPPLRISFHHLRKRLADMDNLSTKAICDGLTHQKVFADDSPSIVQEIRHTQVKSEVESTIITIEEI